jgi:hypothetical protein
LLVKDVSGLRGLAVHIESMAGDDATALIAGGEIELFSRAFDDGLEQKGEGVEIRRKSRADEH